MEICNLQAIIYEQDIENIDYSEMDSSDSVLFYGTWKHEQ
jgi:hypothetical protein